MLAIFFSFFEKIKDLVFLPFSLFSVFFQPAIDNGPRRCIFNSDDVADLIKSKRLTIALEKRKLDERGLEYLADGLKTNPTLQSLSFFGNELGADGTKKIVSGVRENKALKKLIIECNFIGAEGAEHLSLLLSTNDSLNTLSIPMNEIGPKGAESLSTQLEKTESLKELDLFFNRLGDRGVNFISNSLKWNTSLAYLNLGHNQISDFGAGILAQALMCNKSLNILNLMNNTISPNGCEKIANSLRSNSTLNTLNLSRNFIGDRGCRSLLEALRHNKGINELVISYNQIHSDGLNIFADVMNHNVTLHTLDIKQNSLSKDGCEYIRAALTNNDVLSSLDLSFNHLDAGLTSIFLGLKKNAGLVHLKLSKVVYESDFFNLELFELINTALQENNRLESLDLSSNYISDKYLQTLLPALGHGNKSLKHLNLSGNTLDTDISFLASIIEANCSLTSINFALNGLKTNYKAGINELSNALHSNTSLKNLVLRDNALGSEIVHFLRGLRYNSSLTSLCLLRNDAPDGDSQKIVDVLRPNRTLTTLSVYTKQNKFNGPVLDFQKRNRDHLLHVYCQPSYCISDLNLLQSCDRQVLLQAYNQAYFPMPSAHTLDEEEVSLRRNGCEHVLIEQNSESFPNELTMDDIDAVMQKSVDTVIRAMVPKIVRCLVVNNYNDNNDTSVSVVITAAAITLPDNLVKNISQRLSFMKDLKDYKPFFSSSLLYNKKRNQIEN